MWERGERLAGAEMVTWSGTSGFTKMNLAIKAFVLSTALTSQKEKKKSCLAVAAHQIPCLPPWRSAISRPHGHMHTATVQSAGVRAEAV